VLRAAASGEMKGSGQLSSSAKRIQKELAEISLDPPCNCSAGPKGDNIYEWVSTIMGPSSTRALPTVPPILLQVEAQAHNSVCCRLTLSGWSFLP